jgi:predicted metal-binding protein
MKTLKEFVEPKKIPAHIHPSKVIEDLERFRTMALDLGAMDASVITSDEVIIDERVRAKCLYPKCAFYGTNINCPPHTSDLDFVRKLVAKYTYGILFCVKGEPKDFVGPDFLKRVGKKNQAKTTVIKICSEIESRAFYEGYPFALALGQGPCKSYWCADQSCTALLDGGTCRFALKARSSVEALGMDAFSMAAKRGWEVYPCGARVELEKLPHVLLIGLILVF